MIIVVDTNERTVTIDGEKYTDNLIQLEINDKNIPINIGKTISSELANYRGVVEYEGIVNKIQTWFYGKLVKSSWCATCVSYFANEVGILEQIGGKNANVYNMMNACKKSRPNQFYDKANIPTKILKDDILFMLWDGDTMTANSSKHVCVAEYNSTGDKVFCIGGNQKDKICTLQYNRKNIYALFRPIY